jgi:hypothetical protein
LLLEVLGGGEATGAGADDSDRVRGRGDTCWFDIAVEFEE